MFFRPEDELKTRNILLIKYITLLDYYYELIGHNVYCLYSDHVHTVVYSKI